MKKTILTLAIVAVSATAIGFCAAAASASTSSAEVITATEIHTHTHTHAAAQGKHCSGTVGCDCTGFSPITNGKEWQKSYCKKCGHAKSCHR